MIALVRIPKTIMLLGTLGCLTALAAMAYHHQVLRPGGTPMAKLSSNDAVKKRWHESESIAQIRLLPEFFAADLDYPPAAVTVLLNKSTYVLELYARSSEGPWRFVRAYRLPNRAPIMAAEGLYRVAVLDSTAELAFTNVEDAARPPVLLGAGRREISIGGDAAKDLYALAAATGIGNMRLLITPRDFRIDDGTLVAARPDETGELYARLKEELALLQVPTPPKLAAVTPAKLQRVRPRVTEGEDAALVSSLPRRSPVEASMDSTLPINSLTLQGL